MQAGIRVLDQPAPPADARISYGSRLQQFAELHLPHSDARHQNFPLLLFIHGGYWRARYDLAYAGHLCAALAKAGLTTCSLEYRRVGDAGGGWPGTLDDVRAACQYLKQNSGSLRAKYGVNSAALAVAGHSAGGQLALWLAAREPQITAAIALAGVIDLQRAYELHLSNDAVVELLGGTPQQVAEHYAEADPAVLRIQPRQLLVHGTNDDAVPFEISRDYARRKQQQHETLQFLPLSGAGHFDLVDPQSRFWPEVQKAILATLA